MELIGLTGGIGAGKSSVGLFLKKHFPELPIIDADEVAREVFREPQIEAEIKRAFPEAVDDTHIDKDLLAKEIFASRPKRRRLERIMHPRIKTKIVVKLVFLWISGCPAVILDIPLLFDLRLQQWMSRIIVVQCDPEKQLERLIQHRNLTQSEAKARMEAQTRARQIDVVIQNNATLDDLEVAVVRVMTLLRIQHSVVKHFWLYWVLPLGTLAVGGLWLGLSLRK